MMIATVTQLVKPTDLHKDLVDLHHDLIIFARLARLHGEPDPRRQLIHTYRLVVELLVDLEVGRLATTAVALEVLLSERGTTLEALEGDQGRLQGGFRRDAKTDQDPQCGGARGPHMETVKRHPREVVERGLLH